MAANFAKLPGLLLPRRRPVLTLTWPLMRSAAIIAPMLPPAARRSSMSWMIEEYAESFIVKDATGQANIEE